VRAYARLLEPQSACPEFSDGKVYFHRNNADGGDFDDRILAYFRDSADGALELIFCPYRRRYGGSVKCLAYNSIRLYFA